MLFAALTSLSCFVLHLTQVHSLSARVNSLLIYPQQESTFHIWRMHRQFLSNQFWKEQTFWSDGYFVCSIGEASPETIRQYILNQG